MTARDILEAGRDYIAIGWLVFILSWSKKPLANCDRCTAEHTRPEQMEACDCLCCHGFYAATSDLSRFAIMVQAHPGGLLAVRTGAVSGIAVVDTDPDGLPEMRSMVADGRLPRTRTAITGRDGYHMVYAHPGGMKIRSGASLIAAGIDSKADLGYVVAPPSVHPNTRKPYRWVTPLDEPLALLPPHLVDRLREPDQVARPTPKPMPTGQAANRYGEAALRGELEKLLATPEGVRNDTLAKESAFALGQLVAGGVLDHDRTAAMLQAAGEQIGLEPGETRRAIASGFRAGALRPRGGAS